MDQPRRKRKRIAQAVRQTVAQIIAGATLARMAPLTDLQRQPPSMQGR